MVDEGEVDEGDEGEVNDEGKVNEGEVDEELKALEKVEITY